VLRPTLKSCIIASPDESDADRLTAYQSDALSTIATLSNGGDPVTANAWESASGLKSRTFNYSRAKLQELGLVKKIGKGYAITTLGVSRVQGAKEVQR